MGKRNMIALRTDLSVEECLRRLREGSDIGQRTIFSFSGYKGSKPVLSKFNGNEFKLSKRRYYNNSFAPFFFGTLSREERGTHVEGRFGMDPFVKFFMVVWLGLAVAIGLPILISTPAHPIRGDDWIGIVVPLGLICGGILVPKIGQLIGRGEERYLREFVEATLAARTDDSGFSLSARTIENKPL
jgi:hypothetical protein